MKANFEGSPDWDANKDLNYILYIDVTNLYGKGMIFPLPYSGFAFVQESEFDIIFQEYVLGNLNNPFDTDESIGYIFEVDLYYPPELINLHIGLPLAPEHMNGKLIPHLNDRINYKIHYMTLRVYIKLGLKVTKIHRIVQFEQKKWLEPYIQRNTDIRKEAKTPSEKDNAKLMNNAVYGIL